MFLMLIYYDNVSEINYAPIGDITVHIFELLYYYYFYLVFY